MEELSSTREAMWREKRGSFHGTPFLNGPWVGEHVYNTQPRGNFFHLKHARSYSIIAHERGWGVYLGAGGRKEGEITPTPSALRP